MVNHQAKTEDEVDDENDAEVAGEEEADDVNEQPYERNRVLPKLRLCRSLHFGNCYTVMVISQANQQDSLKYSMLALS